MLFLPQDKIKLIKMNRIKEHKIRVQANCRYLTDKLDVHLAIDVSTGRA